MEAKMEALDHLEENGDNQPSPEASLASDVYDDTPVCPCIGSEHQAEIPNLASEDERRELINSSLNNCTLRGYGYPIVVGLALPIMWASPSEVNNKEADSQMQQTSETEARANSRDEESQVTSICPTSNNTGKCDQAYQDPHIVVPVVQVQSDSTQAHDEKLASGHTQEGLNFNNTTMQQKETKQLNPLPCSPAALWSDSEANLFLLGLYIFGKNLKLLSRFLGTKTVGDVLSYYYGKFYRSDAYKRWSDCRKAKTRKCILGERIFQGWRQQELISRLKFKMPKEAHDSLIEVFKSFSESQATLEEFVFALKSTVGVEAFVEAVGIGGGKRDLTGFIMDSSKSNQALSVHPDLPTGKDCSSLASEDIIKFLTGDFRRSKTRSNDIFWEAVWPRLLAKGWHSEQPKDVSKTKNCLVFLVPGIKKFSRSKLTKGTHYFDSVSDVLKKVAADPVLLELEADGIENGLIAERNGSVTDIQLNQDSSFDGYQVPKFTIIDTSLVEGEEPYNVRELRSLPADANINFVLPHHHSSNMVSDSSSEEQDANDRLSNDQEDFGGVAADVKDIEMVSAGSLQNMVTANGHSSNGSDDKIDLTSTYGLKTKTERRKYLSPVSKRRRLASCSNEQNSRRGFTFSKGGGSEREKSKSPLSSSKPAAVDVGDTFQTKAIASCSTKEKPSEKKKDARNALTNDGPNDRMSTANIEDKSSVCKVTAVADVHPKITVDETKFAKERVQPSGLLNSDKLETPHDDKARGSIRVASSDNRGGTKADYPPSASNSNVARDPSESTGRPVGEQPEPALQVNPRRHGTRNRPPTAKALEAVAFGLLGGGKRKGDPKNTATNRPSRRARKAAKDSASMTARGEAEKSSMDGEGQR